MKNTKRLLSALLVLVMLVACMLVVTSCKKDKGDNNNNNSNNNNDNTHVHNMEVVAYKAPTCDTEGHKTYRQCKDCGEKEGYVAIPATHDYVSTITKYPSKTEAGSKDQKCAVCGHEEKNVKIDAITAAIPNVTGTLTSLIQKGTYALEAKKDSHLIVAYDAENYYLALNLLDAKLNTGSAVTEGHIKLGFGMAEVTDTTKAPTEFEQVGSVVIMLNGDNVSIEAELPETEKFEAEYDLYDLLFGDIVNNEGDVNSMVSVMFYYADNLLDVLPSIVDFATALTTVKTPEITDDYKNSVKALFTLANKNLATSEKDSKGNTVYTLDVNGIKTFVDAVDDKTVADFLDKVYGAGTMDSIESFAKGLPDTKVKDLANKVINLAKTLGISVGDAFTLVDLVIYEATGTEINTRKELENRYEKTVVEVIAELSGEDAAELKSMMTSKITEMLTMVSGMTVESAVAMIYGTDLDLDAAADELIAMLKDVVSAKVTVDANGNFVALEANVSGVDVKLTNINGVITVVYGMEGGTVNVTLNTNAGSEGIEIKALEGTEVLFEAKVAHTTDNGKDSFVAYAKEGEDVYFNIAINLNENGVLTSASAVIEDDVNATVTCTDVANGKYTITVNDEYTVYLTAKDNKLAIVTTIGEDTYDASVSFNYSETALGFDVEIKLNDETLLAYDYDLTKSATGATAKYYMEMYGEVVYDYTYSIDKNGNTVTVSYDIDKLAPTAGEGPTLMGKGGFVFSFTPAK